MDKKRSILNVAVSIAFKCLLLFVSLLARRFLITFIGNEANGINSLYSSIVGVLSVAELGIGEAIVFCMYKPIVNGDEEKVAAFYNLFKRIYFAIGAIIAVAGCLLMPFLPYLANGYEAIDVNLYVTFALMLASTVLTYFFSAKTSLMNAYRDNYIATTISSCGLLLQHLLQIVVLWKTKSFVWYFVCGIVSGAAQWFVSETIVKKKYPTIVSKPTLKVDGEDKRNVVKNVKALFMHRIGGVLVNTIDSIIISAFIGVSMLGKYSNYTTILTSMMSVITLFFSPLTSTIGHLFVQDKEACKKYYNFFFTLNFALGCVFYLGYYAVIDDFISIVFGAGLEVSRAIAFVITVNYFIQFMRQATLLFRDASGTFYYDRFKPIFEGISNLILSILFVVIFKKLFGEDFAVVGVIVATIITNICICHIVEPYVLYKHAFGVSVKRHYLRNYGCMAIFVALLFVLDGCTVALDNIWLEVLANGFMAVGLAMIPIIAMVLIDKDFRHYAKKLVNKIRRKA